MAYTNTTKLDFTKRLSGQWHELAIILGIPPYVVGRFRQGHEAEQIWDWLENRGRLDQLPEALAGIDRSDLADLLRKGERDEAEPASAQRPRPLARRWAVMTLLTAIATALVVVANPWAREVAWLSSGASSGGPPSSSAPPGRAPYEARIEGTMDVFSQKYVGLRSYRDPSETGRGSVAGSYPEGGTVYVVCQETGREVRDEPWRDRPLSTRIWYRLSAVDTQWVPSMYVQLVPVAGEKPPVPPQCGA